MKLIGAGIIPAVAHYSVTQLHYVRRKDVMVRGKTLTVPSMS